MNDDDSDNERKLVEIGLRFADAIVEELPQLIVAFVRSNTDGAIDETGIVQAVHDVIDEPLRQFFRLDVDEQSTTPLAISRRATRVVTPILSEQGVQAPRRDPFDVRMYPDDVYGVGPQSFKEMGERVQAMSIEWGAAKAFVSVRRHSD